MNVSKRNCEVFLKHRKTIEIKTIHESILPQHEESLLSILKSAQESSPYIGIAGAYVECNPDNLRNDTACLLTKIAVACPESVLVITLDFDPNTADHGFLWDRLFNDKDPFQFIGFYLDRLLLRLYQDYGFELHRGVDLFSVGTNDINTPRTAKHFVKENEGIFDVQALTSILHDESDLEETLQHLAFRAWAAGMLSNISEVMAGKIAGTQLVNLFGLPQQDRFELASLMLTNDRLKNSQEDFLQHEVTVNRIGDKFVAGSLQYNTRVRESTFELEITFENGETVVAKIGRVKGKNAELLLKESVDLKELGNVVSARTLGQAEPTTLDHQRENLLSFILQGRVLMRENPFMSRIWFPEETSIVDPGTIPELLGPEIEKLNMSQLQAVKEMLTESKDPRIVLVHGPPGTGKTSVIAAMVQSMLLQDSEEETVWIIAQSNVAVKNVAEKLVKIGLNEFKLVVSNEFYFQWHEHLYDKIAANMINSAHLPQNPGGLESLILGVRVILCTVSMITSPRLMECGLHERIPVRNVIVDEASQIQLGDLLPMFHYFSATLMRCCLVGDHKQLAPYGQDEIRGIESIFEKEHIVANAVLLNTTYRLPMTVWTTISNTVYDLKLFGFQEENIPDCWQWINVEEGQEERKHESYVNTAEAEACVHAAKELASKGLEYRVITPYATQTALIRDMLKSANKENPSVKCDDTCFNVDSFQGNESDYIIISLVRTDAIGFLDNDRRSNVLLTRCKKGMFIFTRRSLITGEKGRNTLLGRVALAWTGDGENAPWPTYEDMLNGMELVAESDKKKKKKKRNKKK